VNVLLRAEHLTLRRGDRDVVRDVDLALRDGEVCALLGPNGAGKSTLLDGLSGVLAPAAGRVQRDGRVTVALQSPDLARRTVRANVELALAWWGVARAERRARGEAALVEMHADHLAERMANTLSGGERRRVHLARAVAVRPDLLLLDEPFAGLDPATRAELLEDAAAVLRASARATLVVVHDRAEAWALADRLLVLLDGGVAADGPPRELLEHPPTPAVARFLGFDGVVRHASGEVTLTRPANVVIDPSGSLQALVTRLVPLEDGLRVELELPDGRLYANTGLPGPRKGDRLAFRLVGGVRFPADAE
jgi:ABC-type sulfate/molybdate transport systems ATPase subunit